MANQPDTRIITLVAWKDATKKPPEEPNQYDAHLRSRLYPTDAGTLACHTFTVGTRWVEACPDEGNFADPQPSVWCDPVPPGPNALTVEDLRGWERELTYAVKETDFDGDGNPAVVALLTRLRAALDALGNGGSE